MSKLRLRSALALAAALSLCVLPGAAADVPDPSGDDTLSVSGVEEVLSEDSTGRVTVTELPAEEPIVHPAPGTSVAVRSGQQETVYYGVSASCTHSTTVYTPIRYPQINKVEASAKTSVSAGCSSSLRLEVYAVKKAALGWSSQKYGIGYASPGTTKQVTVVVNCTNTKSTTWRTEATPGAGPRQVSWSVSFACGT